jgi:acetate kinase
MKITDALMVFNAGSSSIKFALYDQNGMALIFHGNLTNINIKPELKVFDGKDKLAYSNNEIDTGYKNAIEAISVYVTEHFNNININAIGHRVVHGGADHIFPTLVSSSVLKSLKQQITLAPSHQPYSIDLIETFTKQFPDIPSVVCFDTEFHNTMPEVAKLIALPEEYKKRGITRYGFHGISYEYIASILHEHSIKNEQKIIVAHLGNGASLCAIKDLKSVETTMSFTTLDGLMMPTRCGSIDPGVILYLLERGMKADELSDLLYNRSGLLGVSEISPDIMNC